MSKGKNWDKGWGDDLFDSKPIRRVACHNTHEAIPVGGGFIIGGNCRDHARHAVVDWYIALDGMQEHPKYVEGEQPIPCTYYPIRNMGVPNKPQTFHYLIKEICHRLAKGHTIHIGCIGGHGRTGLVIAAVLAHLKEAPKDVVNHVKSIYCSRAIESSEQVNFLVKYYEAEKVTLHRGKGVDKSW